MPHAVLPSPVGALGIRTDDDGVREIRFLHDAPTDDAAVAGDPVLRSVREQLDAYFAGELTTFDVPFALAGSPFQRRVWEALLEVPYGHTCTYKELATAVGGSANPRAVGSANGSNPISIVVPCHRVVGSDGTLIGYGGGLDNKRTLLELEARVRITREFAT
ncbi:MAG: methylated-DNA--[protein]-cysteine S-methyltransferase [Streptosporangiales bacterium]